MGTPAQNNANRANAQHSTGPRSVEGKAAASRNSLKFGIHARSMIIPGEDAAALDELTAAYDRQLQPVGPVEAALLKMLVRAKWMQQRYARAEAELLSFPNPFPPDSKHRLGDAIHHNVANYDTLTRIFRRQQAAQRDWYKALDTLNKIQAERLRTEAATQSGPQPETPTPAPNRLRFDESPQPLPPAVPEPAINLALRL